MEKDTSTEQLHCYHDRLRSLTPGQRLRQASALTMAVRTLAEAGIRLRYPGASPEEVRARLAVRLYGRQVCRRLRLEIPDDAT